MKRVLLGLVIAACGHQIKAQCSLDNLFLIKKRTNKFDLINELNSNSDIESLFVVPWREKRIDHKGDSVLYHFLQYNLKKHPCLPNALTTDSGIFGYVDIENDITTGIKLYSCYPTNEFKKCKDNFNTILKLLREKGKLDKGPEEIIKNNEQTGERYYFWLDKDYIRLEYYFEYTDNTKMTLDKYYLEVHRHFADKKN